MILLPSILLLLAALLAAFAQAVLPGSRPWLGTQVDFLPALMVCAALRQSFFDVAALAVLGGLAFDSLSTNTFGVTVLPLFITGILLQARRDLILRDQPFAQFIIGGLASLFVPAATLLLLLTLGQKPLLGWGTLWQLSVMALAGAISTPILFRVFALLNRALGYQPATQPSFRPDREIQRGRN